MHNPVVIVSVDMHKSLTDSQKDFRHRYTLRHQILTADTPSSGYNWLNLNFYNSSQEKEERKVKIFSVNQLARLGVDKIQKVYHP
jgi:hypothetical protein